MKLLNIVHRYWPCRGGSEQYFAEVSERLVQEGHAVSIFTSNAGDTEYFVRREGKTIQSVHEQHRGVDVRRFPVLHLPVIHRQIMHLLSRLPLYAIENIFAPPSPLLPSLWPHIIRKSHTAYDVVHASPLPFNCFIYAAYVYTRRNRIPLAITPFIHVGEPGNDYMLRQFSSDFQLNLLRQADVIFVQTEAEERFLVSKGIAGTKLVMLGMGVNKEEIIPGKEERFRKKFDIPATKHIILHVGSLCKSKGSIDLVEALKPLWADGGEIALVMAGPIHADFNSYIEAQSEAVTKNILHLGFVQGQDKRDMFHACDIMALPSRAESYGIAYLEAWLAKKPVIGAWAGGVPHVINNGGDGLIVHFGNIFELREGIRKMLSNPALRNSMGENGFKKVLGSSTWDIKYPIFRNALLQLFNSNSVKRTT